MGKIVVTEFVSLDGVMEAPGGEPGYVHSGWVGWYPDAGQFEYKLAEVLEHEALLLGRVTYETFATAWPEREGEFADRMNSMPKYVVSTTLAEPEWNNTTVVDGDVTAGLAALKESLAGDLLVAGSGTLVQHLRAEDLVDEYRLMVFPYVLGSGRRLFGEQADAAAFELVGTRRFDDVQLHTYARARGAALGGGA